ncbi:hypothetical protein F971_03462 [Acinetobacter vivianii]|uniref:DUF2290 domain-containing protein n=1 Tax=Acinetobacter vivianii TaxID=1776742 RepID=N8W7U6_9GAMM|nr:DUF2290 domain-containing protein [Acinetobacter vivianii]ENU90994.1 hypothetical protein F971_03462 [Acinetobacter vivianii]
MTDIDLNTSIRKVATLATNLGLDLQHGPRVSLVVSDELKKISRSSKYYKDIYNRIAEYSEFNLMLTDRSCFQFFEKRNNEGEQEVRYAYYPNPYKFAEFQKELRDCNELLEANIITQEEYNQFICEATFTHDIPSIRYDYSPSQYDEYFHPASHFHIGFHGENRWPVSRVLTPYTFFFKILAMYYLDIWKDKFHHSSQETLNDIFNIAKNESYQVPTNFLGNEDKKRLLIT